MTNQKPTANLTAQQIADSVVDSPLFPFELAKQQAIWNLNDLTEQLVAKMNRLATNMTRRAADIASRGTMPNSLGEVQGDAVDIDRLCAQVWEAQRKAEQAAKTLEDVRKLLVK